MAYYCIVTSVDAPAETPEHILVGYELRNDAPVDRLVKASAMTVVVPSSGTAAERRQQIRQQVVDVFTDTLVRAQSRDDNLDAIRTMLVGQRWPQV